MSAWDMQSGQSGLPDSNESPAPAMAATAVQNNLSFAMPATLLDVITNEECNFLIVEFLVEPDVPGYPEDEGHCYRFQQVYANRNICMSWLAAFRAIPQEV